MKYSFLTILCLGAMSSTSALAQDTTQLSHAQLIKKGEYLAFAGDCGGCHTSTNGQEYGGGLPFKTPFGTLYSTNISSDKTYGIGNYTYQDFVNAVQNGVTPKGNLYPAMPYASYHKINSSDMKALYAYFMQTEPANQPNKDNDLTFPFNIRMGLKVWNWLELDDTSFKEDSNKSVEWNRGKYLVQGLGHCSECHTPRNILMGSEQDKYLQGAVVNGLNAPNLTAQQLKKEGWDFANLSQFLQTGESKKGTAFDDMYIVEKHSLTHLNPSDIAAISTYLLDGDKSSAHISYRGFNQVTTALSGYQTYMDKCSGCHGDHGQGLKNVAPALQGNATLENPDIYNTVAVLMRGIPQQNYSQTQSYYAMPSYKGKLDSQQVSDLINFMHESMTNVDNKVTAKQVSDVMKSLENN